MDRNIFIHESSGLFNLQDLTSTFEGEMLATRLSHAIVEWEGRLGRLQRFIALRRSFERSVVASLIVVAGLTASPSLLGGAQATILEWSLVMSGVGSIASGVLMVLDPFRNAKLYRQRLARMIDVANGQKRQLLMRPGIEELQQMLMLLEFAYDILRPHKQDW